MHVLWPTFGAKIHIFLILDALGCIFLDKQQPLGHSCIPSGWAREPTVVDVKAIGKKADECSAQLRQLDMQIQSLNFQTELV
jgi:hypothetical protein